MEEVKKNPKIKSLSKKIRFIIVCLSVLLVISSVIISHFCSKDLLDTQYDERASDIANIISVQMNYEDFEKFYIPDISEEKAEEIMNSAEYKEINDLLYNIRVSSSIKYLYIVRPTENGVYYLFDTDEPENAFPLGYIEEYYKEELKYLDDFLNGKSVPSTQSNSEFGWLKTVFYPVNIDGKMVAYICMDYPMDYVLSIEITFLVLLLGVMIVFSIIFLIITLRWMNKVVIKPINNIAKATKEFVNNKENSELGVSPISKISIHTNDELEVLSDSIKTMEKDINSYIENITAITAEREKIGAELNVATQIQANMLPRIFPAFPEHNEFDIYATMTPAKEVGGDFYDFFLLDNDHLAIVIADVSGKGVPAALFMVIAKTLIKNQTQINPVPSEVFTKVNEQLCEDNESGLFVTAWMGILELSSGKLTFVNAGHNPPLLKKNDGEFEYLKTRPGFVLAGMEEIRYKQNEISLSSGDILYLYTDGVTEATSSALELYGEERLKSIINNNAEKSTENILKTIKSDIDLFVGEAPQFDDITMLCLKYKEVKGDDRGK